MERKPGTFKSVKIAGSDQEIAGPVYHKQSIKGPVMTYIGPVIIEAHRDDGMRRGTRIIG
jgi:hypothetical protein